MIDLERCLDGVGGGSEEPQLIIKRQRDIGIGEASSSESILTYELLNQEAGSTRCLRLFDSKSQFTYTVFFSLMSYRKLPKSKLSSEKFDAREVLVELRDLKVLNAEKLGQKYQSLKSTKTLAREFPVTFSMLN